MENYNSLTAKQTGKKSFDNQLYKDSVIAELLVLNKINISNKQIMAVRTETEDCKPDLNILDRVSGELLFYVEVQAIKNFSDFNTYRYPDFLIYQRRLEKDYEGKTVVFIAYDLITGSYLITSLPRIIEACKTARIEYKDRFCSGSKIQEAEKIYHIGLDVFKMNKCIDHLDKIKTPSLN